MAEAFGFRCVASQVRLDSDLKGLEREAPRKAIGDDSIFGKPKVTLDPNLMSSDSSHQPLHVLAGLVPWRAGDDHDGGPRSEARLRQVVFRSM